MRNKNLISWIFCIISLLFVSCYDDMEEILPTPPDEEDTDQADRYIGKLKEITLRQGMEDFHSPKFICRIMTEDGTVITRTGNHLRLDNASTLTFRTGIKDGIYRLLELKYSTYDPKLKDNIWHEYGLGCRIQVKNTSVKVLDSMDKKLPFYGEGTKSEPYSISSGSHFNLLAKIVNNTLQNSLIDSTVYFQQNGDIDMSLACEDCDPIFKWTGIGMDNLPFRGNFDGNGYTLTNLTSTPVNSETHQILRTAIGAGLFAYTSGATIKNVHLDSCNISGTYGIGGLVGIVMTPGDRRCVTSILGCTITNSQVKGVPDAVSIGGLVGATDLFSILYMDSCRVNNVSISGDYNVGGMFGGAGEASTVMLSGCETNANTTVESFYSCAGGLIGAADSLAIMGSTNRATVKGATHYTSKSNTGYIGAGGLVGGSGCGHITASFNEGNVTGYEGVGGFVGTTRIATNSEGDTYMEDLNIVSSKNKGNVTGKNIVGGLCGESQFSCYSVINEGTITASGKDTSVGGIVGNTSSCAAHNAINKGTIVTTNNSEMVGGIVGRTVWGSLYACQNYGRMNVNSKYLGGIAGGGGNYTVISDCANMGYLENSRDAAVIGGIVATIGDPKNWTKANRRSCIIATYKTAISVVRPMVSLGLGRYQQGFLKSFGDVRKCILSVPLATRNTYKSLKDLLKACQATILKVNYGNHYIENSEQKSINMENSIKAEITQQRNNYTFDTQYWEKGLNTKLVKDYLIHTQDIIDKYEVDSGLNVNLNINLARQKRYDEVENWENIEQITHNVIQGVCWITSTAISIGSTIATGGASSALIVAGIANGLIGGTNAITANTMDFNKNADIVTQCVNTGNFQTCINDTVGGIVGNMEQYGILRNCLNTGANVSKEYLDYKSQAGIVGNRNKRTQLDQCLNLSLRWNGSNPLNAHTSDITDLLDNYQYIANQEYGYFNINNISASRIYKLSSYTFSGMDVNSESTGLWLLKESKGNYPIPWNSEMAKDSE